MNRAVDRELRDAVLSSVSGDPKTFILRLLAGTIKRTKLNIATARFLIAEGVVDLPDPTASASALYDLYFQIDSGEENADYKRRPFLPDANSNFSHALVTPKDISFTDVLLSIIQLSFSNIPVSGEAVALKEREYNSKAFSQLSYMASQDAHATDDIFCMCSPSLFRSYIQPLARFIFGDDDYDPRNLVIDNKNICPNRLVVKTAPQAAQDLYDDPRASERDRIRALSFDTPDRDDLFFFSISQDRQHVAIRRFKIKL